MVLIMRRTHQIAIFFFFVFSIMNGVDAGIFESYFDYMDGDLSAMNESLIIKMKNLTTKSVSSSSSPIIKALTTKYITTSRINNMTTLVVSKKQSTSSSLSLTPITTPPPRKTSITTPPIPPYMLVSFLVDQFNHYRNVDLLSRIKVCDPNLKLHDMCEIYSFDNHTYSLIRELPVEFPSLKNVYDALIDRIVVQKLSKFCSTGQWCLENLTQSDIHLTLQVIRQRGRSFCSMEKCSHRLAAHVTSCPSVSPKNLSTPTLKLLPMLCDLYQEQQSWSATKCANEIVYLLHILYAYWPQLEICHNTITAGSGGCTPECFMFDSIFHHIDNQCGKNASFLTRIPLTSNDHQNRVPSLAWYRLINLQQTCRHETAGTKSPFMASVENLLSSNLFWYRLHQRPIYAALFVIIVFCIVISFSVCLYMMSKNDSDSNTRRLDDDYEYTRLHDSTFELGASTQITNGNATLNRVTNESHFDLNGHHRLPEHQRLLHMES